MIKIHATKKLYAKLPVNKNGLLPSNSEQSLVARSVESENPLSGWHANLLTIQRKNCILLVHDETRFPLFMKGLIKKDFANFNWHFNDTLMNTLLKIDANHQHLDNAAKLLSLCQFDTDCNRSVQGTLNQMKGDVEHMIWYDQADLEDISTYRVGAWLSERPCNVKGIKDCIFPYKAILELLS